MDIKEEEYQQLLAENERLKKYIRLLTAEDKNKQILSLRMAYERYQLIFQKTPIGIFYYDNNLVIEELNVRFSEIVQVPYDKLRGLDVRTVKDQRVVPALEAVFNHQQGYYEGEYITTQSNISIYCIIIAKPYFYMKDNQRIHGGLAIIEDITQRKKAELELKASEQKFRQLLDNLPLPVFIKDKYSTYTYVNKCFSETMNIAPENIVEHSDYDVFPEELAEQYRSDDVMFMEFEETIEFEENTIVHGTERNLITTKMPMYDSQNNITGVLGIFLDITQRKKAEYELEKHRKHLEIMVQERTEEIGQMNEELVAVNEELQATNDQLKKEINERLQAEKLLKAREQHLQNIFRKAPVGVGIINEEGTIEYANYTYCNIYKCQPDKILNQPLGEIFPEVQQSLANHNFNIEKINELLSKNEWQLQRNTNDNITVFSDCIILKENSQQKLVMFMIDITQRKKAEKQLQAALEKEKELSRLKSNIVSIVSHEFRTPLSIIMSSAEMLHNYHERLSTDEQAEELQQIMEEVNRMTTLIDDVLFINKIEAHKQIFSVSPFDFIDFFYVLADDMHSSDKQKHHINIQSNKEKCIVKMNKHLVRSIFSNLLSNALKYSPENAEIHVELLFDNENVTVHISDKGIGIPEKDQHNLFSMFHRSTNVGNIQGTGLGLAIVKRGVEAHNGKITLKSEINKGSTFTVVLPLQPK